MIDHSAQKDYFPQRNGTYYSQEGFIIRFDYVALIPPHFEHVQINFGVFKKGETLDPFLKTSICQTEMESTLAAKCILTEKRQVHKVQPHIDSIIYFEIHATEKDPNKKAMMKRAWTMHEIFDIQNNLICGKFKLPFYNKSLNPQLLIQTGLPQMTDSSLFIRICFENDPNFDNNQYVFIENEYKVPQLHLRQQLNIQPIGGFQSQKPEFKPQIQIIRDQTNGNQVSQDFDTAQIKNYSPGGMYQNSQYPNGQNSQYPNGQNSQYPNGQNNNNNQQDFQQQQIFQQQQEQLKQLQQQLQKQQQQQQFPNQNQQQQFPQQQPQNTLQLPNQQKKRTFMQPNNNENQDTQQQNINSKPNNLQGQQQNNQSLQQPQNKEQQNNINSSKSIGINNRISDDDNLTDGVVVKIQKINGFKIAELDAKINMKILEGENVLLDLNNQECNEMIEQTLYEGDNKLDVENVFQIKVREMIKTYQKLQLEKVYLFISIISGNQSLAWIATPLFKVAYINQTTLLKIFFYQNIITPGQKPSINNGKFTENFNKPPVKKPPFTKVNPKSDMSIEYVIHDPDMLPNEVNEIDTIKSTRTEQKPILQTSIANGLTVPDTKKVDQVDGPRNILLLEMDTLTNYKNDLSLSYDLVILKPQEIVNDEFGNPSVYHFDELIPPKEDTDYIEFKTAIKIPLDLQLAINKKLPDWEQYHIIFKFVEVDDDDKEQTLGWLAHPLFKNKKINSGTFNELLYDLPLQISVPLNRQAIKKRMEKLSYNISIHTLPPEEYNLLKKRENLDSSLENQDQKSKVEQKSVFTVVVHELKNLEKALDLQINIALLLNDDFMNDDLNEQCTFQGNLKKCEKNTIQFLEEYNFEIDAKKLAIQYKDQLNKINLVFYFLNKSREPKYWFFCKLFDNSGNLHLGTFETKVFMIPIQKMTSINPKKLKESKAIVKYSFLEGNQPIDDTQSINLPH